MLLLKILPEYLSSLEHDSGGADCCTKVRDLHEYSEGESRENSVMVDTQS
jgi:hypothetical protein